MKRILGVFLFAAALGGCYSDEAYVQPAHYRTVVTCPHGYYYDGHQCRIGENYGEYYYHRRY